MLNGKFGKTLKRKTFISGFAFLKMLNVMKQIAIKVFESSAIFSYINFLCQSFLKISSFWISINDISLTKKFFCWHVKVILLALSHSFSWNSNLNLVKPFYECFIRVYSMQVFFNWIIQMLVGVLSTKKIFFSFTIDKNFLDFKRA